MRTTLSRVALVLFAVGLGLQTVNAGSAIELAAQGIEQHRLWAPGRRGIIYFGLTDADPPGYPKVCLFDEQNQPKPA